MYIQGSLQNQVENVTPAYTSRLPLKLSISMALKGISIYRLGAERAGILPLPSVYKP